MRSSEPAGNCRVRAVWRTSHQGIERPRHRREFGILMANIKMNPAMRRAARVFSGLGPGQELRDAGGRLALGWAVRPESEVERIR